LGAGLARVGPACYRASRRASVARLLPALLLLFSGSTACSSVDVKSLRFQCANDRDCSDGWFCDPASTSCMQGAGDGGAIGACKPACRANEVCDPALGRCRSDCEPKCDLQVASCDLARNRCVLSGGSCRVSPPTATADGFDARFLDLDQG